MRVMTLLTLSWAILGCALVPGVPAGTIGGRGVRVGGTFAYAYTPAAAQVLQPAGAPATVRANSAMFRGAAPFIPLRVAARVSPGPFLDVGADVGWIDFGLQLRAGQLDPRRALPWGFELEWRTGQHTPFDHDLARRVRVYRARAELYPALGGGRWRNTFGVLTLGVSTGSMYHFMDVPEQYDLTNEGPFAAALELSRRETRLELSLGVHGRSRKAVSTVALMPWLALHQGALRGAACGSCTLEPRGLSAPWGFAVVASGSIVWERQ